MGIGLSQAETHFFGYVQGRTGNIVRSGDLVDALGLTPEKENKLLSRLSRRKLIARVTRGLYLVPARLPPGGSWTPSEALAINTLIEQQGGRYQISGPNAFSRYGWDDQVPNSTFAYNNRISGRRTIGTVGLTLVKLTDARLGSTEVVKTPEGLLLVYASKARALMDAVYDWSRFNTLPRAYDWIKNELQKEDGFAADLVSASLRYGNQGTLRRLGKLLEMSNVQGTLLRRIEKALHPTSSFIAWIPSLPKRGTTDKRWKVVVNG